MSKKIMYVNGSEVTEEELEWYKCHSCDCRIDEYEYGFIEDAYGNLYCSSEQECLNEMILDMDTLEFEEMECEDEEE
tara:strand:+ start:309 stop:539 length:231 start_codon:yes stop_codon:yes gene_type:complete